jgi:chitodextrinase
MNKQCGARQYSVGRTGVALVLTAILPVMSAVTLNSLTLAPTSEVLGYKVAQPVELLSSAPSPEPAPQPQAQISVAVNPPMYGLTLSRSVTVTATVANDSANKGVTWSLSGSGCSGSACGTLSAATTTSVTYTAPTVGGVYLLTATSVADVTKSATASMGVTDLAGVYTYRNDSLRSSINSKEYVLTPSNVNKSSFGKLFSCTVDGSVYAQPLWVANVSIGGGIHNVVIVATQHDSVYAFDADNGNGTSCTQYWKASMLLPTYGAGSGATPVPPGDTGETGDIITEIGITSTPVIDPTTNNLFVVSKTKESGQYYQRLHRLNLTTGTETTGSPQVVAASVTGSGDGSSGGVLPYIALHQNQRPGLALVNGTVYMASGSHGDNNPWHGWIIGYDATALTLTSKFCTSPNTHGGGIWMSGSAPVVDSNNNLYVIASNGQYNGTTEFGDSFLKLSTSGGLTLSDWFTPDDEVSLNSNNGDLGAGGAVTLLDSVAGPHPHLLIGGGKEGVLYLLNRDGMGHYNANNNNAAVQTWSLSSSGISSSGEFWQNTFYIAGVNAPLQAFAYNSTTGLFNTNPTSQSNATFAFPGLTPAISASGTSNAIMWAVDSSASGTNGAPTGPDVLYAFDATNLGNELYDSTQAAGNRDQAGNAVKFAVPTVANGKVYVGALGQLNVYGLLNLAPAAAAPSFSPSPGGYVSAQTVTLSDTTSGAAIYYTTDGSVPTTASSVYSSPISVGATETINAMATAPGLNNSTVASGTYTIQGTGTGGITFVQGNYATPQTSPTSVNVTYTGSQTQGDLNVVVVGWNNSSTTINSVTDSKGNNYTLAVGPTTISGVAGQSIYYLKNISASSAGSNTVTVSFSSAAAFPDIRILEYGGVDPNTPVDVTSASTGSSATSASAAVTTTNVNDLLFAANLVVTLTTAPGSGFANRMITSPDGDIAEDRLVAATGSYSASATLSSPGAWIMQMVAFRAAASTGGDTTPPSTPTNLTATPTTASQINLAWTASTDNVGVTGYIVQRCQGSGCTSFSQIASITGNTPSYSDTGLNAATPYSYQVQATDAAGNLSTLSSIATATTLADTTPPSIPTNLVATPVSTTQINLTWTASTDNVGVAGYNVQSCQGANCTNFAQLAQPGGNSANDTGLTPGTSYSYRVQAFDAAGNLSGFSTPTTATTPSNDTTPPTAPSNLMATASSSSQINLSWTASTDNVGVTGYLAERCQGAGCTNFVQIATPSGTSLGDNGLAASTSYSYRVRARDAAGNLSGYSNIASATTQSSTTTGTITFVQVNSATPQSSPTSVSVTFTGAQTAGNLNVVVVGWNDSTAAVSSVVDSKGNNFTLALGPTSISGAASQAIYYLKNIPAASAGSNAVTITFNGPAAFPDIRILEYSGADSTTPVDVTSASTGNSTSSASAAVTTTNAADLLFGANLVQTITSGPGTGFTKRIISSPDGDIAEDRMVTAVGSYSASATVSPAGPWIMQMVAFRASGSPAGDTTPPSAPSSLTATAVSSTQINLSWTASTDNVGVTGYNVQRCSGSGCTTFAQVTSVSGTTTIYNDTGLAASTSYSYRVQATDAAGNLSLFSNTASATTSASSGTPGLVAAYDFNAGSGTTVSDVSGNGNTGTIVNATWTTSGKFGNALSFNGTNAQVVINDSASLHLTTAVTLEAWVNPSSAPTGWQDVIYKPLDNYFLEASSTNGNKPGTGVLLTSSAEPLVYGSARLAASTWAHLAMTYDGTTLKIYVNGTLASSTAQSGTMTTSTNALQIGGDTTFGQYFKGLIDEVRIYNIALTQAQIQSDMATALP